MADYVGTSSSLPLAHPYKKNVTSANKIAAEECGCPCDIIFGVISDTPQIRLLVLCAMFRT